MVPSGVVRLTSPQTACSGKIHTTRLLSLLISFKQSKPMHDNNYDFLQHSPGSHAQTSPSIQSTSSIAENLWFEVLLQAPLSSHPQALPTNLARWRLLKPLENLRDFYTSNTDCCLYSSSSFLPC